MADPIRRIPTFGEAASSAFSLPAAPTLSMEIEYMELRGTSTDPVTVEKINEEAGEGWHVISVFYDTEGSMLRVLMEQKGFVED